METLDFWFMIMMIMRKINYLYGIVGLKWRLYLQKKSLTGSLTIVTSQRVKLGIDPG